MAVDERLTLIAAMGPKDLRAEWERMCRVPSPPGFGPDLLARALAYAIQEKARGGLASGIVREIRRGVALRNLIVRLPITTSRPKLSIKNSVRMASQKKKISTSVIAYVQSRTRKRELYHTGGKREEMG